MAETKICTYCGDDLPIDQFRLRWKNSNHRHSQCDSCHRKDRRARKRLERAGKASAYATDVVAAQRDRNKVIALTSGIVQELGSVAGVIKSYKDAIEAAKNAGRHYTVFRLFQCTFDLILIAGELQTDKVTEASDEDLHERVQRQTMALIREHPELAVSAANKLGWKVLPPGTAETA